MEYGDHQISGDRQSYAKGVVGGLSSQFFLGIFSSGEDSFFGYFSDFFKLSYLGVLLLVGFSADLRELLHIELILLLTDQNYKVCARVEL